MIWYLVGGLNKVNHDRFDSSNGNGSRIRQCRSMVQARARGRSRAVDVVGKGGSVRTTHRGGREQLFTPIMTLGFPKGARSRLIAYVVL